MLYLKLVPNEFKNESRDKRELSVVKELGYETLVVDTTKHVEDFWEIIDGYRVYHISTRRYGESAWMRVVNRGLAYWQFIRKTIEINADVISGHDYLMTLAAYIANCCKRHRAKLIYESHEFELYQDPNRSELALWTIQGIEGFLIRRVNLALTVGDKIADGVQEIYHLERRPTVVRNIPPYWHLEPEKAAIIRRQFIEKLGLPDTGFLLMYHGGIVPGRGIEYAIQALSFLPDDIGLVIMGFGMIEKFRGLAQENGVAHRVYFHPAVPMAELKDYIGAVDVELVLQSAWCVNVLYSLPNKFFESIQSCVPFICCDLPEMGKIVRQYDIGLLVHEDDEKSVAEAVMKLRKDKTLYDRLKRNMEKAKMELCWEKESLKLKAAIQGMIGEGEWPCKG